MTDLVLVAILFLELLLVGALCSYVAGQKNRSKGWWFGLGLFFNFFALIALAAVPALPKLLNESSLASDDPRLNEKWATLAKYDENTKAALKKLEIFGSSAQLELKKAYFAIGDPSALHRIADQIAFQFEQNKREAHAATRKQLERIRLLSTSQQIDALGNAIFNHDASKAKLVISAGIDVNATNEYGVTPLRMARNCNCDEIVALLLEAGARE